MNNVRGEERDLGEQRKKRCWERDGTGCFKLTKGSDDFLLAKPNGSLNEARKKGI